MHTYREWAYGHIPANLAAQSDLLPPKRILSGLELHAIDAHLLLETAAVALGVLAAKGVCDGDALLAQHVIDERAGSVFPADVDALD